MKQMFRDKVGAVQLEHQELEHAEQVKIAEQKRVEQAKIVTTQQKARQEKAAEAARRAALEKDTAYIQELWISIYKRDIPIIQIPCAVIMHPTHWKRTKIVHNPNQQQRPKKKNPK